MLSFSPKRLLPLGCALFLVVACGGNKHKVKTPDERLQEQLALADQQAANPSQGNYDMVESDSEQAAKFDPEFADHQMRLATLNAKDCPNSLPDEEKKKFKPGKANIKVVFQPDGVVKEVMMDPGYAETAVGACLTRAYESIQIKPYSGDDQTLEVEVELKIMSEAEKKKAKEKAAKEAQEKE